MAVGWEAVVGMVAMRVGIRPYESGGWRLNKVVISLRARTAIAHRTDAKEECDHPTGEQQHSDDGPERDDRDRLTKRVWVIRAAEEPIEARAELSHVLGTALTCATVGAGLTAALTCAAFAATQAPAFRLLVAVALRVALPVVLLLHPQTQTLFFTREGGHSLKNTVHKKRHSIPNVPKWDPLDLQMWIPRLAQWAGSLEPVLDTARVSPRLQPTHANE